MPGCFVLGCKNDNYRKYKLSSLQNVKFHRFPKDVNIAEQWVIATGRTDKFNIKGAVICSDHFEEESKQFSLMHQCLNYYPKTARNLKHDAIPTLKLPHSVNDKLNDGTNSAIITEIKMEQSDNDGILDKIVIKEEIEIENTTITNMEEENVIWFPDLTSDSVTSSEIKPEDDELTTLKQKLSLLQNDNARLQTENSELQTSIFNEQLRYEGLQSEVKELKLMIPKLEKIFTPTQIKKLFLTPTTNNIVWSKEDIESAMSLYEISRKAYGYLLSKGFPLPALRTLRRWREEHNKIVFVYVETK